MESGADPTAEADDGTTPVDVAEQYQCTAMLDCLQCNFLVFLIFFFVF